MSVRFSIYGNWLCEILFILTFASSQSLYFSVVCLFGIIGTIMGQQKAKEETEKRKRINSIIWILKSRCLFTTFTMTMIMMIQKCTSHKRSLELFSSFRKTKSAKKLRIDQFVSWRVFSKIFIQRKKIPSWKFCENLFCKQPKKWIFLPRKLRTEFPCSLMTFNEMKKFYTANTFSSP